MTSLPAIFERFDDEAIEARVAEVPADAVVGLLHEVGELRRAVAFAERMLRSRITAEEILAVGEPWTAPNGDNYIWAGDRERVCSDPTALRLALSALPLGVIATNALSQAFKDQPPKVYLTHLDGVAKFGGDEAERVIRSFVSWKEGAPKLRLLGEDGK